MKKKKEEKVIKKKYETPQGDIVELSMEEFSIYPFNSKLKLLNRGG